MQQTVQDPAQYDPEYQFAAHPDWLYDATDRPSYEAACMVAGVTPNSDDDIDRDGYGLKYAEFRGTEWRENMSRDQRVLFLLDGRRLSGIEAEQAAKAAAREEPELVTCDCGHRVRRSQRMTASLGTACPDCYDRMSN